MNLEIVAQNIRRLRSVKNISQVKLSESSGVSLPAIKNLERAKNEPRIGTLQAIADALDVQLQELFVSVRQLKTVRFRSKKNIRTRNHILTNITRWLDDFNYLEKSLNKSIPYKLKDFEQSEEDIAEAASFCRQKLGIKITEPIYDICGILEKAGIKLYPISFSSDAFFGLSIGEQDGGPAIIVNTWDRISVERQIFSSAHEIGHLLLHQDAYDVTRDEENSDEERQADVFAGHFLMPNKAFLREWKETYGLTIVNRVMKIKRIFRVSYKTVLMRLIENGVTDNNIWKKFSWAFQKETGRKLSFKEEPMSSDSEPFRIGRYDFFEDRLSRLTRKAIEEEKISISRGAEILRINIEQMQELISDWEVAS